jgi:hypothetical protein
VRLFLSIVVRLQPSRGPPDGVNTISKAPASAFCAPMMSIAFRLLLGAIDTGLATAMAAALHSGLGPSRLVYRPLHAALLLCCCAITKSGREFSCISRRLAGASLPSTVRRSHSLPPPARDMHLHCYRPNRLGILPQAGLPLLMLTARSSQNLLDLIAVNQRPASACYLAACSTPARLSEGHVASIVLFRPSPRPRDNEDVH